MSRFLITAALAIATGAASLSPALAQSPNGMMGMMGGGCPTVGMMGHGLRGPGGWGDRGWFGGMMGRQPRMGAMVEGRLAYLKGELNVTEAQKPAWDAYAAAVGGRVDVMQGMHLTMVDKMRAGSAIERMDARIAAMEAMLESMKALKPATEGLYAVLTPEQKAIADDLIGGDCGAF